MSFWHHYTEVIILMGYFFCTYLPDYTDFKLGGKIMSQSTVSEWALGETPSPLCKFLHILTLELCMCIYVCITRIYAHTYLHIMTKKSNSTHVNAELILPNCKAGHFKTKELLGLGCLVKSRPKYCSLQWEEASNYTDLKNKMTEHNCSVPLKFYSWT